nr:solute carrier family 22 member 7-like [Vanessa tameamea]
MSNDNKESGVNDPSNKHTEAISDDRMAGSFEKPLDLDDVLVNELGQFGWFQLRNVILVSIPIMMSAFMSEFIFSSAAIPHRCRIPECGEYGNLHQYDPEWILNAVPETSSGFSSCQRYVPRGLGTNGTLDYCPADLFNNLETVECDGYVYARDNTIVYDFDLGCQDWLRALPGTLNSVGTLLVLPITGYISDRFGRKRALIISVFNLGLIGLIRAFSVNYIMYVVLQILQTTLGAGTFSSAYIFAAELVGPKYRVITSSAAASMFAVGQVVLGSVAWLIHPWRYMIMALHIPCFLVISYYWILSESVRWLLAKKKFTEAREVLETVAKVNNKHISQKSLEALMNTSDTSVQASDVSTFLANKPGLVRSIVRSPTLLRRVCTIPIWWITSTFVYYGLSINSTGLSDTIHLNYILTCAVEIPGNFASVFIVNIIGRKATLSCGFFFSALCNIVFIFISNDLYVVRLIIFMLGKFGISVVMTSLYLYTSELYPTEFRHSLLAFSSMIGRIGSITAPLTPVLMNYWHGIPSILFGGMGIIAGLLVLTQPETTGTKMPDTLAEAEALGRNDSKLEQSR